MSSRPSLVSARHLSLLPILLTLIACSAGLAQGLLAQTAHFSGAVKTLGSGFRFPTKVAVDGSGNVFVADAANNAVKEIVAAGGYTTVNTLGSGFNFPEGVAVDGSGNVFVGDTANNAVKEIVAAGGYTTVNTLGSGFSSPEGVAVDGSGNVFVADPGNNAVKEIVAGTGGAVPGTVNANSTVNPVGSGFISPIGVAVDGSGNVFVADAFNSAVKEIVAAGGYTTVNTLGSGFSSPFGVAVDGSGNVFVADGNNDAVKEIVAAGGYTTVNTLGSGFHKPSGVAVDGSGNVFVADTLNNAVKEIVAAGGDFGSVNVGSTSATPLTLVFTFDTDGTLGSTAVLTKGAKGLDFTDAGGGTCSAGTSYTAGQTCTVNVTFKPAAPGPRYGAAELLDGSGNLLATGYVQGTGVGPQATFATIDTSGAYIPSVQSTRSGFLLPFGVAVDGSGNVFVAAPGDGAVKEIVAADGSVHTLGSGFSQPRGVAVDGSGNVFVADANNSAVKEIVAADGSVPPLGSGFKFPEGVAVDGSGNVFVADTSNNAVKEIVAAGGYTTVHTLGSGFRNPTGVVVDGSGNVFVADTSNNAVKEIVAAGGYTTVNTLGSGFSNPTGVVVDGSGNVFVTDSSNNAVKEIVAAGGYTTVNTLGSGFSQPVGVAVDGSGNVFVADTFNNAVKKLDYADPPSLSFAPTNVGSTSSDSPQTVAVSNIGNADLTFPMLAGDNPSIASGFTLDGTCPQLSAGSAAGTLAHGTSCTYAVDFTPKVSGPNSGSLVLTDDNLNAAAPNYATQSIGLSGTATGVAPSITTNPSNQTVTAGLVVTFTAAATGNPTPTVQWQVSSFGGAFNNIAGATSTTLSFTTTAADNGNLYHAVFTNSVGTVTTMPATLTVNVGPAITANPSNQAVPAGSTATFTAAATGKPTPTVQWQVSIGNGAFNNIAGATSTTLSFTTTAAQNGNRYRAVFTNSVGTGTTTSATLTVEDFSISASPKSQTISAGHSAAYTVTLASLHGLTGNVALTCSGGPPHSTCTITPGSLMLNGTATAKVNLLASQSVNHGTFTLTFTGKLGNITHSAPVSLTVK